MGGQGGQQVAPYRVAPPHHLHALHLASSAAGLTRTHL